MFGESKPQNTEKEDGLVEYQELVRETLGDLMNNSLAVKTYNRLKELRGLADSAGREGVMGPKIEDLYKVAESHPDVQLFNAIEKTLYDETLDSLRHTRNEKSS